LHFSQGLWINIVLGAMTLKLVATIVEWRASLAYIASSPATARVAVDTP